MAPKYMKFPDSEEEWLTIAEDFNDLWDFPHCVGAMDGKHVVMRAPYNSGSIYFNYKGAFSIVLMAVADARYKFIAIDVGAYGRSSDGGVFANSNIGRGLISGKLNLPQDRVLDNAQHLGALPYAFVGDEAF